MLTSCRIGVFRPKAWENIAQGKCRREASGRRPGSAMPTPAQPVGLRQWYSCRRPSACGIMVAFNFKLRFVANPARFGDDRSIKLIKSSVACRSETMGDTCRILEILGAAKKLAQEYRQLTGKPLGITGEVAEYEAARILGVELTAARQAGYDAIEARDGAVRRLQIKGRCLLDNCKPGQRLGSIRTEKEWDAVLMVLLDQNFDAVEIYEAERTAVVAALAAPGSKARNERGAMPVSKFKSIGRLRWQRSAAEPFAAADGGRDVDSS
jgi:hypothetical protein